MKTGSTPHTNTTHRLTLCIAGLLLFATGYGIANRIQLTFDVIYRITGSDHLNAAIAFLSLSVQASMLLVALVLLSRRATWLCLFICWISIAVNLGYGQLIGGMLESGSFSWLLAEARHPRQAIDEFGLQLLFSGAQAIVAVILLGGAQALIGMAVPIRRRLSTTVIAILLLVSPSLAMHLPFGPMAAERNIYGFTVDLLRAPSPPSRAALKLEPDPDAQTPRHIVWIIDESVAQKPFSTLIQPEIAPIPYSDFGIVAALGNCSSPAHVALRSGVDVRRANQQTDLRRTPSIWAYAQKAGYITRMIDGQVTGAPQNILLAPEQALIEDYRQMAAGIDTDLRIASAMNAELKKPQRSFTYVTLRGVHFQYRDHYPKGTISDTASIKQQYATALSWSKRNFFQRLLQGVDRQDVAIIYSSDHGQNLQEGALPHCSRAPVADEFRVPLIAFLPDALATQYAGTSPSGHSASQIFPATLIWMGFDKAAVEERYDRDLMHPTARYVWFGRKVVPIDQGDDIEITVGTKFPGTD